MRRTERSLTVNPRRNRLKGRQLLLLHPLLQLVQVAIHSARQGEEKCGVLHSLLDGEKKRVVETVPFGELETKGETSGLQRACRYHC